MKASRLAELGFKEWHPLKGLSASDLMGAGETVFIIGLRGPRSRGIPEVQFIGRAKRPMKKILGGLVIGYGAKGTTGLHKKLMAQGTFDRAEISWRESKDSKAEQRRLLSEYRDTHGVLPLWNRKGKAKPAKAKPAKAKPAKAKPAKAKPAKAKPAKATGSGRRANT